MPFEACHIHPKRNSVHLQEESQHVALHTKNTACQRRLMARKVQDWYDYSPSCNERKNSFVKSSRDGAMSNLCRGRL
jgi:hypothetical protein